MNSRRLAGSNCIPVPASQVRMHVIELLSLGIWRFRGSPRPSSSASRLTAGAAGFLTLIQVSVRPETRADPLADDALAAERAGVRKYSRHRRAADARWRLREPVSRVFRRISATPNHQFVRSVEHKCRRWRR